jgi:hypothetical protein
MPLSWNEIKTRAIAFAKEWEGEASEGAEAKSFWDAFFDVFGVHRRRIASFEVPIRREDGSGGFIDLLWKGILLVEHKSLGKDLVRAYGQARDYFPGLKDRDLPRYVLVSDFARFCLYDLDEGTQHEFPLKELPRHIRLFGIVAGYQSSAFKDQDAVNVRAAERMGRDRACGGRARDGAGTAQGMGIVLDPGPGSLVSYGETGIWHCLGAERTRGKHVQAEGIRDVDQVSGQSACARAGSGPDAQGDQGRGQRCQER